MGEKTWANKQMRKKNPEEILPRKNQQPNSAIAFSSLKIFSFKTDLSVFHCQQPTMPTPYNYYINKMIIISTYIHTDPYDPLTKKELRRQNKQTKQNKSPNQQLCVRF